MNLLVDLKSLSDVELEQVRALLVRQAQILARPMVQPDVVCETVVDVAAAQVAYSAIMGVAVANVDCVLMGREGEAVRQAWLEEFPPCSACRHGNFVDCGCL